MSDRDYLRIKATTPYYNFARKFAFPSLEEILLAMILVDTIGVILVYYLHSASLGSVLTGFKAGLLVFAAPSIASTLTIHRLALRRDPLFNLRRCFALSLFSSMIWIGLMVLGVLASRILHNFEFPSDAYYLGIFIVAPIRAVSVFSMSSSSIISKTFSAMLEPFLSLASASLILQLSTVESALALLASAILGLTYTALVLVYVEGQGLKKIGTSPIRMFRGFLLDWLDRSNGVLESQLEELSLEQGLSTTVLGLRRKGSKSVGAILVVSNFHPGPFLNVGSSILPQEIQKSLEKETKAVVAVPHGISGHEMNLVSQEQNQKVVKELLRSANFSEFRPYATRLVRANFGNATASCQAFGNCSFVTITLSPNDMEDIPLNVGVELTSVGKRFFDDLALVDAHNCIRQVTTLSGEDQRDIVKSASDAMERAAREPSHPFRFGAAKITLEEFTSEQGIGPGGLVALVIEVADQLSGYLIVDGNNMKAGLRERILKAILELGIEFGEVMTTDTHVVNGIVPAKLGYYPVGEAINEDIFMKKVLAAFSEAKKNLEDGETSSVSAETRVKTLGLGLFKNMTELIHQTSKLVALSIIPTILISGMIFTLILMKP